jgi:DNA-binding NarL/FixJ family response regulator
VDELLAAETDPATRSDIVVLDVTLGDHSWVADNVRRLRAVGYRVIILTGTGQIGALRAALVAGAAALVDKADSNNHLFEAIKVVHSGTNVYLSRLMAESMYGYALPIEVEEREILRHAAGGLSRDQIATLMDLSGDAVDVYFRSITSAFRQEFPEPSHGGGQHGGGGSQAGAAP